MHSLQMSLHKADKTETSLHLIKEITRFEYMEPNE